MRSDPRTASQPLRPPSESDARNDVGDDGGDIGVDAIDGVDDADTGTTGTDADDVSGFSMPDSCITIADEECAVVVYTVVLRAGEHMFAEGSSVMVEVCSESKWL